MTAARSRNRPNETRLAKIIRSLGIVSGLIAASTAMGAMAQDAGYRSAASAPASWQAFAKELESRFLQRLAADDDDAHRFQKFMANEKDSPASVVVHAWIEQTGKVERLDFEGLQDSDVAANLRALLVGTAVSAPPADMLQPLHLRLALQAPAPQSQDH